MPQRLVTTFAATLVALLTLCGSPAWAQTPGPRTPQDPPVKKHKPNPYGSPLDTIMSTRLWTDVPPAQDFVRQTRPAAKDLDYTPLTGKDPVRPKPRDPANVLALQAEMEQAGARNDVRLHGAPKAARTRRKAPAGE